MSEAHSTRQLAARLIAHAQETGTPSAIDAAALAMHRMSGELSRLLGVDGCLALLTRVLARARQSHPALADVGIVLGSNPHLELPEGIEGEAALEVAAGLETALADLFDLLGRLIGDDLSVQLADLSLANATPDAAKSDDEGAPGS